MYMNGSIGSIVKSMEPKPGNKLRKVEKEDQDRNDYLEEQKSRKGKCLVLLYSVY